MNLEVQRCLSNHSLFQVVDELLKFFIYHHYLTPSPVAALLQEAAKREELRRSAKEVELPVASAKTHADMKMAQTTFKCDTFAKEFLSVRDCLRNIFRSTNHRMITDVIFGLGGSSLKIKLAYRVRLPHCRADPPCQQEAMSERELMALVRSFFTSNLSGCDMSGMKVFVFLRAAHGAAMPKCQLKGQFKPESLGETNDVRISHHCCTDDVADNFNQLNLNSTDVHHNWYLCNDQISGFRL